MMCAGYPISLVGVHIHRPANLHAFCVTSKHLTQVCAAMSYRTQIYLKNHLKNLFKKFGASSPPPPK